MFYTNDMNIHTAVFVDTLNTSPGVISNANWGNSATGNWGSIKINRTYLVGMKKCKDYESTISITQSWPFTGVKRGTEHGIACQMPDGRWIIEAAS
jgi:surface antigen